MTQKNVGVAQEVLAATEERYAIGATTLVTLSKARATYVEAAGSFVQTRYDILLQHLAVAYFRGTFDTTLTSLLSKWNS